MLFDISRALLLEACEHDPSAPLAVPDKHGRYSGPTVPMVDGTHLGDDAADMVGCVAVGGDHALWMLALCSDTRLRVVLRGKACLSCSPNVCRGSGYPVLVC